MGGNFEDIKKFQLDISKELGRNIVLNQDLYKDLYAAQQVTGQNVQGIVKNFKDVGANTYQAIEGMQKVVDVSRQSGVNAQAVSGQVLKNMDAMNKFTFQGGVEGMAKMAAQAVSLRFDMSQVLKISENLFDPENAIEMAASLQRLGAQQSALLDPLKLMDMGQNDPAELQNQIVQLSQQFVQLNEKGQFEIMPGARRQLREISKAIGINYEDFSKMALGAADLDKKMSEINFGGKFTEEQRNLIANMAEMGKGGGEYKVKVFDETQGKMIEKAVSELRDEDLAYLEEVAEPKTLEQLAKEQLDLQKTLNANIEAIIKGPQFSVARSQTATQIIGTLKGVSEKTGETLTPSGLQPEKLAPMIDDVMFTLGKGIKNLVSGDKDSLESFVKEMGKLETRVTKYFNEDVGGEISTKSKQQYGKMLNSDVDLERNLAEMFKKMITFIENNTIGNSEMMGAKGNIQTKNAQDAIIINTLPQDSVREINGLAVGTNLDGNMNGQQNSKMVSEITININANPDVNKLFENMNINKEQFRQELMATITKATNSGVVGNTNPNNNPMIMSPTFT